MPKSIKCLLQDNQTRVIIDLDFYPTYCKYTWYFNNNGYVETKIWKNGKRYHLLLSHLVMDFDPSIDRNLVVDHKYHNTFDNRKKKLRIVTRSINNKNRIKCNSNTGIPGIHLRMERKCYSVNYSIDGIQKYKEFRFTDASGKNQQEALSESTLYLDNIKETDKSYREAFCLDEDESSSCSSINEEDYQFRINYERVIRTKNTSGYKHIYKKLSHKAWMLNYYDKYGAQKYKYLPYDNEESLDILVKLRDKHEKYRPKIVKKPMKRNLRIKNSKSEEDIMSISSKESNSFESNEGADDASSDSTTISMDQDEIDKEILKSENAPPEQSIHQGVGLDLKNSLYFVTYYEDGYFKVDKFPFQMEKNNWWEIKLRAEKFKDDKNKLL